MIGPALAVVRKRLWPIVGFWLVLPLSVVLVAGCDGDMSGTDAGAVDSGTADASPPDASIRDAGPAPRFTLTFTVRTNAMVDAFDTIEGREVTCEIAFPLATESGSPPRIEYRSGPSSVVCTPDPPGVVGRMSRNLDGASARLTVFGTAASGTNQLRFAIEGAPGAEVFRIDDACDATGFPDDGARPVLRPFSCVGGSLELRRYTGGVSPTILADQVLAISTITYAEP